MISVDQPACGGQDIERKAEACSYPVMRAISCSTLDRI